MKLNKYEQNHMNLWDYIKKSNIDAFRLPKGEENENRKGKTFP